MKLPLTPILLIIAFHAVGASLRGNESLGRFLSESFSSAIKIADTSHEQSDRINPRIIGGIKTPMGRSSYTVSLQDGIGHFCGGSLIARDVVLTAAHCQGGSYNVAIGRDDLNSIDGESIPIKFEVPHPKYNDVTTDSDWNLVFLSRPTKEKVTLININHDANSPRDGREVFVMGWGDITEDDRTQQTSSQLLEVGVNVISNKKCDDSSGQIGGWSNDYHGRITDNMICAMDVGQDACQGDSGGPLIIRGKDKSGVDDVLIGVVSWGVGCASKDFPGVYSRVSQAYDWIKSEVCAKSVDPPTTLCGFSSAGLFSQGGNKAGLDESSGANNGEWKTLLSEDFSSGYGPFRGGKNSMYQTRANSRDGVVRIQNGNGQKSSMYSNKIVLNGEADLRVTFSYMGISMGDDASFCLDASTDGRKNWDKVNCWSTKNNDFLDRVWQDDVSEIFSAPKSNNIFIRFRCYGHSNKDDILLDKVRVDAK